MRNINLNIYQGKAMAFAFSNLLPLTTLKSTPSSAASNPPPPPPLRVARRALLVSAAGSVFLSTSLPAAAAAAPDDDSRSLLLQKYLKKSQENKDKNDKERLESYYKRNYKDYFGLVEGSLKGKDQLSDTEKEILDWLQNNR